MAKTSGGVRGGNNSNGQSKVQKALQVHEAQIRNNNYESAFVVNDNGETLLAKMGKQYKVEKYERCDTYAQSPKVIRCKRHSCNRKLF